MYVEHLNKNPWLNMSILCQEHYSVNYVFNVIVDISTCSDKVVLIELENLQLTMTNDDFQIRLIVSGLVKFTIC